MIFRRTLLFVALAASLRAGAADEVSLSRYVTVVVEPVKTSIYVGSVTLSAAPFTREGITYSSTYSAKVFPYFFYNEKGKLWIDFTDDRLRALERGETVEFTGHALNNDGEERRIEGRVQPADATTGKIKVRIFVSKRIELIFNTTYRFGAK